jgi:hypothetical protein
MTEINAQDQLYRGGVSYFIGADKVILNLWVCRNLEFVSGILLWKLDGWEGIWIGRRQVT